MEEFQSHPQQVLDPQAAYELISIMTDNAARTYVFGAHSPLILSDRTVAAKTGTTNNWHDGWTVGFTPSLAAGVWAGNNDGTLLAKGADGVFVAAPIWNDFMKQALAGTPAEDFKQPDGITKATVDKLTGKLPSENEPASSLVTDIFASYAVPTDHAKSYVSIAIDSLTGERATDSTPPNKLFTKHIPLYIVKSRTTRIGKDRCAHGQLRQAIICRPAAIVTRHRYPITALLRSQSLVPGMAEQFRRDLLA